MPRARSARQNPCSSVSRAGAAVPAQQSAEAASSGPAATADDDGAGVLDYRDQPPPELQQQVRSLQDFTKEGEITSYLGMVLRQTRGPVDGGEVAGLLVVSVIPGSAAAQAGLENSHNSAHWTLLAAGFAASLFFPPALIGMALVGGSQIGESFDMIIGVDSVRVVTLADFTDCMSQVHGGEVVYLSIVRSRHRLQIPVKVPTG